MDLKQYLEYKNSSSAFAALQSEIGGNITFSNSGKRGTTKEFTLGLDSFISILKDIKKNIDVFAEHEDYEEKSWRDIGSQYYSDGPANAMSTVQTKPLFATLSKIIAWANQPELDEINTDQNCSIKLSHIDSAIKKLEQLGNNYRFIAQNDNGKSKTGEERVVIESKTIRDFALSVFKYFYNNKWNEIIESSAKKDATIDSKEYTSFDYDVFTRLLAGFDETKNKSELTTAGTQRYFDDPVFTKDGKYYYFTTQWNSVGESELSFKALKKYFENKFKGYKIVDKENRFELIKEGPVAIPLSILTFSNALREAGMEYSTRLTDRFIASLLTKPFVILTGLSGSGKTKLVQAFAHWITENEKQYCIIPVGSDWTNREPLLGFPNALNSNEYIKPDNGVLDLIITANANENKPYFLILDEMNLSHVERYFADFLSVMESNGKIALHSDRSGKKDVPSEITLPKNLFIIGTVNIDETTYMFSPKVLDRANVIEFRVTEEEMEAYLKKAPDLNLELLKSAGIAMAEAFVEIAKDKSIQPNDPTILQEALLMFFRELKNAGAEFGYRSAAEIIRFAGIINKIESSWTITEIIDAAIMQKLLPKIHGSRRKLDSVLKTLGRLCLTDGESIDEFIMSKTKINFNDSTKIKYPVSLEKILRMYKGIIDNGFTSYAEA